MRSLLLLFILSLVFQFSHGVKNSKYLAISPYAEPTYIMRNQILISCKPLPPPINHAKWSIRWVDENNAPVDKKFMQEPEPKTLTLQFSNRQLKEGNYTCQFLATNDDGNEQVLDAISVQVKFAKEPNFANCAPQQYLTKGSVDSSVICDVDATPSPTIVWQKDGKSIFDDANYLIEKNGIKILKQVGEVHSGIYNIKLNVFETGNFYSYNITVIIVEKPEILEIKSEQPFIIEGKQTKISCVGDNKRKPLPRYYWLDAAKRNLSETGNLNYEVNTETGDLVIKTGQRADEGQFTCIAQNDFGVDEKQIEIKYAAKPEFYLDNAQAAAAAENGQQYIDKLEVLLGQKAEIVCAIKHSDLPANLTIRKKLNGNEISDESRLQIFTKNDTNAIYVTGAIPATRKDDIGVYECVAENIGGNVVQEKVLDVVYSPQIQKPVQPVKIFGEMQSANLTCNVDANPKGIIKWYKNEVEEITNSPEKYKIYNTDFGSQLEVKRMDAVERSAFKCVVSNTVLGKVEQNQVILKLEEASPPSNIQVRSTNIKQRQITLKVDEIRDNGLPILNYRVKLSSKESEVPVITDDHPANKNFEIVLSNLKPNTNYAIEVAASNKAGYSLYSTPIYVDTAKETAPDSPEFTHDNPFESKTGGDITSEYTDEYTVKWSQPDDNGAEITEYIIKYYKVVKIENSSFEKSSDTKEAIANGKSGLVYRLAYLDPDTYYKVEIQARNVHGLSASNFVIFKTARGVGSPPEENIETRPSTSYSVVALVSLILVIILMLAIIVDIVISINCGIGISHYLCPQLFHSASMAGKGDENNTTNHHTVVTEEQTPMMDKSSDGNTKFQKDSAV